MSRFWPLFIERKGSTVRVLTVEGGETSQKVARTPRETARDKHQSLLPAPQFSKIFEATRFPEYHSLLFT